MSRNYYNHFTDCENKTPKIVPGSVNIYKNSISYAAVFEIAKIVSAYANYATTVAMSLYEMDLETGDRQRA